MLFNPGLRLVMLVNTGEMRCMIPYQPRGLPQRLYRVIEWANELGAAEEIPPRLQIKYVQTVKEIHKIHLFLEGLELLLGDEKFGPLRHEAAQFTQNATNRINGIEE